MFLAALIAAVPLSSGTALAVDPRFTSSALDAQSTADSVPLGNLPGWKQVLAQDFNTPAGLGSFGTYNNTFFPYTGRDTYGHGIYNAAKVNSVSNGVLDWFLHKEGGQPYVSGLAVKSPATGWAQQYGRYSVRFRSDEVHGYKMAFMLWPKSDNWGEGEIDFPEANQLEPGKDNLIYANLWPRGNTGAGQPGTPTRFQTAVSPANSGWHTTTIEWTPGRLTYYLDGVNLGTHTSGVPSTQYYWVLQVETSFGGPDAGGNQSGHLQVDWVTMYTYAP